MGKTLFAVITLFLALTPFSTFAAVSSWQQSASIGPRWAEDFSSETFRQSLRNLKAAGADWVTLIIPWYQSNTGSIDIGRGWNTPPDPVLIDAINYARAQGLKVSLKPHLESYDGSWRAHINPGDRTGWFRNYGNMLKHYAALARDHDAEEMVLGTELISMASQSVNSTNAGNWVAMIGEVRAIYSGRLTYSANWGASGFADEKNQIGFWHALDVVGISAYFDLTSDWNNSVDFLKGAWDTWNRTHILPLHERTGKPILFTEVGYRSVGGAHTDPWNCCRESYNDETEQANSYEALFSYWNDQPFMIGASLWDWSSDPNAGGPGDIGYTPQRKKAEETMKKWWLGSAPAPAPTPPPSGGGTPVFSTSTNGSPGSPAPGQSQEVTTTITNSGSSVSGIVDIEIYNAGGTKIFQKILEGETLAGTKTYAASWTAASPGDYRVKIGIFKSGWSGLWHWEDNALTVSVGGTSPSPSPSPSPAPAPSAIEVWWPTDGSRVGGTQPFKALLSGKSVSEYNMFWQVDGDSLNTMSDNFADYPHKEVSVDLSGWTWKGDGPYALKFIAQTFGGTALAEKLINIFVVK